MPRHCPFSPHPPPHTARPCPLSGGVANCWVAVRGEVAVMASPPAHLQPPLPSPLRPAEGQLHVAVPAG